MKSYFWKAYCHQERWTAIDEIKQIVNKYACIIDFKLFSDVSISFQIELDTPNIPDLYQSLKQYMPLDEIHFSPSPLHSEATIFLNVTFIKGTGNLSIEVPNVPG